MGTLIRLIVFLSFVQSVTSMQFDVMSPNTFRIGVEETIGVTVKDISTPVEVDVYIHDRSPQKKIISRKTLILQNGKPQITTLLLRPDNVPAAQKDNTDIFVDLAVKELQGRFYKEIMVPVTTYSGYVFVQTDKPIYFPNQIAFIRIFYLDEKLIPSNESITLDVKNPHGSIILYKKNMSGHPSGITDVSFRFPSSLIFGNWSVTVYYGYKMTGRTTVRFEVKDYVLPTFSVKFNTPKIVLKSDEVIRGDLTAEYVYGTPVQGYVNYKFAIRRFSGELHSLGGYGKLMLKDGKSKFAIRKKDILKRRIDWFPSIDKSVLVVEAEVVEQVTGKREAAYDDNTIFTTSPYEISFSRSLKEFKPGAPYQVQIDIRYINKQPFSEGIPVKVSGTAKRPGNPVHNLGKKPNLKTDLDGKVMFQFDTAEDFEELNLKVETAHDVVGDNQASAILKVLRYNTPVSKSYVWIASPQEGTFFKVGKTFQTQVIVYPPERNIKLMYLVVSRGTLLIMNEIETPGEAIVRTIQFPVTVEMSPSFRLIVYIVKNRKIIADSIKIDVERSCKYNDDKEFITAHPGIVYPTEDVEFKIKGEDSVVAVAAVDEAVYLINKRDVFTREKMFKEMDKHDLGSGPGGGINPAAVFNNAGLLMISSNEIAEHGRKKEIGQSNQRRKRSLNETGFLQNGSQLQEEKLSDDLINLGEKGALRNIRRFLPETWFFDKLQIGDNNDCKGDKGECKFKFAAPHSITTWVVHAIGVSRKTGICVADPLKIKVFKDFFVHLTLPPTSVRGEQIEVLATVFNYGRYDLEVYIYMFGVEGVCMGAGPGERTEIRKIKVPANNASSVNFLIMPMVVSEYSLRVVALSSSSSDAVEKKLRVVPEGIPVEKIISFSLDPNGIYGRHTRRTIDLDASIHGMYDEVLNKQMIIVDLDLPKKHIPGTEHSFISFKGDLLGQSINPTLLGLEEKFLKLPTGNGEQTMLSLAPIVYTMSYFIKTNQMTGNIEKTGYRFMWRGYSHQLNYKRADGSYAIWNSNPSSTWLTAFVAKVFCQASAFIPVLPEHINPAIEWLVNQQKANGAFDEAYKVHHAEMTGGVHGDVSLTAFVLISMLECNNYHSATKRISINKAILYLEHNIQFIKRPHTIALVAYALALTNSSKRKEANQKLKNVADFNPESFTRFWISDTSEFETRPKPDAVAVETTSYALLTQLQLEDLDYAHPIANWLNRQLSSSEAFVSTQDTVIALHALTEYSIKNKIPLDITCKIFSSVSTRWKRTIHLKTNSSNTIEEIEVPTKGRLYLEVSGKGLATLSLSTRFNVEEEPERKCQYDLAIKIEEYDDVTKFVTVLPEEYNSVENQHLLKLNICVKYLEKVKTDLSILNIGLLTGYKPFEEDLINLIKAETVVSQFETSDRSVILYLHQVPNDKEICFSLRTSREFNVGKVQPTFVKLYNYYEPDKSCIKFYGPNEESVMLEDYKHCEGRKCVCMDAKCPPCFPFIDIRRVSNDDERRWRLLNVICDRRVDFFWNGTLKKIYEDENLKYFDFEVTDVLKEGVQTTREIEGEIISFVGIKSCKCPNMEVGKAYMIISEDGFRYNTVNGEIKFKYLFGRNTRIYNSRPLRLIPETKGQKLQKTFNTMYYRFKRGEGCYW